MNLEPKVSNCIEQSSNKPEPLKGKNMEVVINPRETKVYCRVCNEWVEAQTNFFTMYFFCNNPKCTAYLRRSKIYSKLYKGHIRIEKEILTPPCLKQVKMKKIYTRKLNLNGETYKKEKCHKNI